MCRKEKLEGLYYDLSHNNPHFPPLKQTTAQTKEEVEKIGEGNVTQILRKTWKHYQGNIIRGTLVNLGTLSGKCLVIIETNSPQQLNYIN